AIVACEEQAQGCLIGYSYTRGLRHCRPTCSGNARAFDCGTAMSLTPARFFLLFTQNNKYNIKNAN
ncbi:MAG: hypothetical protein K2J48_07980, partial [Muribaculaceae bacterium]|nr:hypothetical protein [Muribaculaceae bacterium]